MLEQKRQQVIGNTHTSSHHELTGEVLLQRGLIDAQRLEEALKLQEERQQRIGEILFALSNNSQTEICQVVAEALGVTWARPDLDEIPEEALACVSAKQASHYAVIPISLEGDRLLLATAEPQDLEVIDELELLLNRPIEPVLAMSAHIHNGIKKHYGVGAATIEELRTLDKDTLVIDVGEDHHSIDDDINDASIIQFVNQILLDAYRLTATDIHFEPGENTFSIRYRIDGMLEEVSIPTALRHYQSTIISRIKVMAKLDIAEQRMPQDGAFQVKIAEEIFDLRVSVLPTPLGEGVQIRLLRRGNIRLDLEKLGYTEDNLKQVLSAIQRPNGIILVTGPTGSGKTTTLYSLLEKINTPNKKIITIEDPIEYHLGGMLQMQVHEEIGFTFARALRSILRHDPDIVLLGEIRDGETAEIAIRMAMTGHLVLSTLHANDASSTIARLVDMGQEPYLLASTIICVIAQRLIRRICLDCREEYTPDVALLEAFQGGAQQMPQTVYRGKGCESCRRSGYLNRTAINETFVMDDDFRKLVMERSPAARFRQLAREKEIKQMREDGLDRVLNGQTTIDEILRVTQAVET
jgi:type II secretory ATPase GspE/PulE/Tfp pilus assembly ATPase PilB-like protein